MASTEFTCECKKLGFIFKTEQTYYNHFNSKKHKEWEKENIKKRTQNMIAKYVPHLANVKK